LRELNAWLHQNGLILVLKDGKKESETGSKMWIGPAPVPTHGLNGLYLNLKGREREGIVSPGKETEALKEELRAKLDQLIDPASGTVSITGMFDCEASTPPYTDNAPT